MDIERLDTGGLVEHEVAILMSNDELAQMRLAASLALFYLPSYSILDDFLDSTE